MAVGSRYGITSFSITPRTVRLQNVDSFASSLTVSPEDVHSRSGKLVLSDFFVLEYFVFCRASLYREFPLRAALCVIKE